VISVIVYGRNDAHGYNLHRRAALSLNCIAEVLTHDDDEILFVDYNTPDELPSFVEAIADTLTDRCLDLLRVLRVPAAIHRRRFAALTRLHALDPVCRNVAARRATPTNRWLLSTNTDMIFVPRSGDSLSDICSDLADGFYGLPRYELPEWVWERLPRSSPDHVISELARLGPRLRLDEATTGDEWIRFDAPGDFQLCLREDFAALDGFDERMLKGWHADSNFSKRVRLRRGSIDSLEEQVAGYHCNHSRSPTIYHGAMESGNDLGLFYDAVERAELPAQRDSWGLADVHLEEVAFRNRAGRDLAVAVMSAIPAPGDRSGSSRDVDAIAGLTYDSRHVLPHVADSVAVSPPHTTFAYVGANPVLEEMLGQVCRGVGLTLLSISDESVDALADPADVFVVDLGLDSSSPEAGATAAEWGGVPPFPASLRSVKAAFEQIVAHERRRLERGEHPRRFVLVHSATVFTDPYVVSNLDCSHTSTHSRVRRATVRLTVLDDEPTRLRRRWADRLTQWATRLDGPDRRFLLPAGRTVDVAALEDFGGFGVGWAIPDTDAIWTTGKRAELRVQLEGRRAHRHDFSVTTARVGAARGESLHVGLEIDGAVVATRQYDGGTWTITWRVPIPPDAVARGTFDVGFLIEPPRAWQDDERQLGLHVRSFGVVRDGLRQRMLRRQHARAAFGRLSQAVSRGRRRRILRARDR
jgi:hypothetical protein